MALTVAGMAAALVSAWDEVEEVGVTDQGVNGADIRYAAAQAEAEAIIGYLTQNAQIRSLAPLPVTHPQGPGTVNPFTLPAGTSLL